MQGESSLEGVIDVDGDLRGFFHDGLVLAVEVGRGAARPYQFCYWLGGTGGGFADGSPDGGGFSGEGFVGEVEGTFVVAGGGGGFEAGLQFMQAGDEGGELGADFGGGGQEVLTLGLARAAFGDGFNLFGVVGRGLDQRLIMRDRAVRDGGESGGNVGHITCGVGSGGSAGRR